MKIRTIIALMAIAMVSKTATAQAIATFTESEGKKCYEYLSQNPTDTAKLVANNGKIIGKLYFPNGDITVEPVFVEAEVGEVSSRRVNSVKKNGNTVDVVLDVQSQNGAVRQDTITFKKTTAKQLSFQQRKDYQEGKLTVVSYEHKDFDGNFRHRLYAWVGAGAVAARSTSPEATLNLGYETCHFLFELEGMFASNTYTESADYHGRYLTFSGVVNVGWKFWQDRRYRQSVSINVFAGYGLQKSDGEDALDRSTNYGRVVGGKVRYTYKFANWFLLGEAGAKLVPEVPRGEEQNYNAWGGFVRIGAGLFF